MASYLHSELPWSHIASADDSQDRFVTQEAEEESNPYGRDDLQKGTFTVRNQCRQFQNA